MEELDCFPPEILRNPQPFIAFHGLDVTKDVHKKIWEVFTHTRGNDRYSLFFRNFSELNFPQPKPAKSSYEWYVAKGVLKKGWVQKYQNVIPSVLVLFGELDWTDPNINKRTEEFTSQIQLIKDALKGMIVLIQTILIYNDNEITYHSKDVYKDMYLLIWLVTNCFYCCMFLYLESFQYQIKN